MIAAMRDLPEVCRHLHLPVQSGSTRVLAAMRRRHTREQYLELVGRLREAMPDIALSTDMIVGFPGETDDGLRGDAVADGARSGITACSRSSTRQRPNTLALKRMPDDVPEEEKTRRIVALQALQKRDSGRDLHEAPSAGRRAVLVDSREPAPRLGAVGPDERATRS